MGSLHATMNISIDACCDHTQVVADDEFHMRMSDLFGQAQALLFGRNTYELLYSYWPQVASGGRGTAEEVRLADILNEKSTSFQSRRWLSTGMQSALKVMLRTFVPLKIGLKELSFLWQAQPWRKPSYSGTL